MEFSKYFLFILSLLTATVTIAADTLTKKVLQVSDFYPTYPTPDYSKGNPKLIDKGAYLVKIGDCISCHTNVPAGGKPFAGGLPIHTPFGTYFTPNITADKKTGIGNWSLADFIRAMHEGINPAGSYYFPVFPYTSFTKVNEQDLAAIFAYLLSIPAVQQENKEPTAPWPFSWRFAQLGWRILFFSEGYYDYNPDKSVQWNRGAYLVEGLGHCGECHTPRNFLGAMKQRYYLTGAFIEGYWAPNITGYGLQQANTKEITQVFEQAELINQAGPVRGPMAEVDHNSLMNLSKEDLLAIAVYLQSLRTAAPNQPMIEGSETLEQGKIVYNKACAMCHDSGVAGAPRIFDTGSWTYRLNAEGLPTLYQHAILGFNIMPPKGGCVTCSDGEIRAAVNYIIANSQSHAKKQLIAGETMAKPDTSLVHGEQIYAEVCAVCHADGRLNAPVIGDQAVWEALFKNRGMDTLIQNSIKGTRGMPAKGGCIQCSNADIIAAVKFIIQKSIPNIDVSLW